MIHLQTKNGQCEMKGTSQSSIAGFASGLVTNFDGTISSLTTIPQQARISPACQEALAKLSELGKFKVIAVISGRSAEESRRLVGLDHLYYIGNNGLEILAPGSLFAQPVKAARPYLNLIKTVLETIEQSLGNLQNNEALNRLEGSNWARRLVFENKRLSASIHYRQFANDQLIKSFLLEKIKLITTKAGLSVEEGPKYIEIRPPVRVNKGTALVDLCELYGLNNLIYLGSDATDLEAFMTIQRLTQEHRQVRREIILDWPEFIGLKVAVQNPETPPELIVSADRVLEGIPEVEKFLGELSGDLN
jgi:trehalose 6-phosphate phosphatase